jgi:hypothetical protein
MRGVFLSRQTRAVSVFFRRNDVRYLDESTKDDSQLFGYHRSISGKLPRSNESGLRLGDPEGGEGGAELDGLAERRKGKRGEKLFSMWE